MVRTHVKTYRFAMLLGLFSLSLSLSSLFPSREDGKAAIGKQQAGYQQQAGRQLSASSKQAEDCKNPNIGKTEIEYRKTKNKEKIMIEILQLQGTAPALYTLVAPLVMNPAVLRQNNNFPFRTTEKFVWLVAIDREEVLGFMPMEQKRMECVINNYYIKGKNPEVLERLMEEAVRLQEKKRDLAAISFVHDVQMFEQHGFVKEKTWTRYVRMVKKHE